MNYQLYDTGSWDTYTSNPIEGYSPSDWHYVLQTYCPKCGGGVDCGDHYCKHCGEHLIKVKVCPHCGKELAE